MVKGIHGVSPGADDGVDYRSEQFPNAINYAKCHISIVKTLRSPNNLGIAAKVVEAIHKVFTNIGEIDPDRILK